MRKKVTIFALISVLITALAACTSNEKKSVFDMIRESPVAKLLLPDGSKTIVDSEISSLHSFADLNIQQSTMEPADKEEDWLYRIIWNPSEKVKGAEEIIVSFHEDYVQINTEYYLPEKDVSYQSILEWAESKFTYFME
ncbi:MAG: hypothetical protein IJJ44_08590 [Solobacterium sp.]|nr:hypothetical protein [Solobacterium sp.]